MTIQTHPQMVRTLRVLSIIAGVLVVLTGTCDFLGWVFDTHLPRAVFTTSGAIVNPLTALCFIAAGAGLVLMIRPTPKTRRVAQAAAGLMILVGFTRLLDIIFGWDVEIDRFLFRRNSRHCRPRSGWGRKPR